MRMQFVVISMLALLASTAFAEDVPAQRNFQVATRTLERDGATIGQVRFRGTVETGDLAGRAETIMEGETIVGIQTVMPRLGRFEIKVVDLRANGIPVEVWFASNGFIGVSERDASRESLHQDPPIEMPAARPEALVPGHLLEPKTRISLEGIETPIRDDSEASGKPERDDSEEFSRPDEGTTPE